MAPTNDSGGPGATDSWVVHERLVAAPRERVVAVASDLGGYPVDAFLHQNARAVTVDRLAESPDGLRLDCDREDDRLRLVIDERPERLVWHRTVDGQPGWTTTETYGVAGAGTRVRIATELHEPGGDAWAEVAWPWRMLAHAPLERLAHLVRRSEGLASSLAPVGFDPAAWLAKLITRCDPRALELIAEADHGEGADETRALLCRWAVGGARPEPLTWQVAENLSLAGHLPPRPEPGRAKLLARAALIATGLELLHLATPELELSDLGLEDKHRTLHRAVLALGPPTGDAGLVRPAADLLLWLASREPAIEEGLRVQHLATATWLLARDPGVPAARLADLVGRGHGLAALARVPWPACPDPVAAERLAQIEPS
ncbi:MAG: hypothetical protein P1V81_17265 [Planctomycetota bacterium]|nr:hypothetical protein [Planctomycetota bacterium]